MTHFLHHLLRRLARPCALLCLAWLAGCASAPPAPVAPRDLHLPRRAHVTMQSPGQPRLDGLLIVQAEGGDATRWSLFDPFGMPMARQILRDGKWRNDGFMRPNGEASDMFSAILFAWTPVASLPSAYAGMDWRDEPLAGGGRARVMNEVCNLRWRVTWQPGAPADRFTIVTAGGATWQVEPLGDAP
ncbi:hypothetical protein [Bordetella genomosp. 9]|uniref:Lipoprotein n=1 Tax=Bordetella genomosp. 9 TaxID=1416803 RepID=A0A1W6Z137_9BORD|nr:hypothetical protein [Bordetella genomosp. 9]ARP87065.1 hypothetical protein CAL13_13240 [Bordetella genomosp. 9]ARP91054.1 hypothetical protein CAL14_12765 [Bordetella genomosp. 9]